MAQPEFTIKYIKTTSQTTLLSRHLITLKAFAIDIETSEWWNRHSERIALIQFAYRTPTSNKIKVIILDPLADIDLTVLQTALENSSITKIIHNASFDAIRLQKHYNFQTTNIYDTMIAARSNQERKYSLKAQADIHLKLRLNKESQKSDWSRRPLSREQLYYAALDLYATLLLYEDQTKRGLSGAYRLRPPAESKQIRLPLKKSADKDFRAEKDSPAIKELQTQKPSPQIELTGEAIALLGIISELPTRYGPDSLIASVESGTRVGLAGWIIDTRLGEDAEPDEETIKGTIRELCERELIRVTDTRRLTATEAGNELWQSLK